MGANGKTISRNGARRAGAGAAANARMGLFVRLSPEDRERAQYWCDKRGYPSLGEYVAEAVAAQIRRENGDYDLPTLEIARLTQMCDLVKALSANVANLERVTTTGFDAIIGLTKGDSYLLDGEDGELT